MQLMFCLFILRFLWFLGHNLPTTNVRRQMKGSKMRIFAQILSKKREISPWGGGTGSDDLGQKSVNLRLL